MSLAGLARSPLAILETDGCVAGAFDRITFAIFDRTREQETLAAFQRRFGA